MKSDSSVRFRNAFCRCTGTYCVEMERALIGRRRLSNSPQINGGTLVHPQVQAALDRVGVFYRVFRHSDLAPEISTPIKFATILGYELERVCKTLLLRGPELGAYALGVCSANRVINLSAVAGLLG